jgi:hypothetical protein
VQFAGESGSLTFAQLIRNQVFAPGRIARSFAILLLLAAVAGLVRSRAALAQSEAAGATDASLIASERQVVTAPVVIDGRVLFRVRGVTAFPAAERAATIAQRIRAVAEDRAIPPSELHLLANDHWIEIVGGENSIMGVFDYLHRSVLDVFNEYSVQMMTPAYIADPAEPKVVPPERLFAKPAEAAAPVKISRNA